MRTREFFDRNHATNYLVGSIIRVGEEPVLVTEISGRKPNYHMFFMYLKDLGDHPDHELIPLDDEDVNMEPVPLGFAWSDDSRYVGYQSNLTLHVHRIPIRTWKIGLYSRNCETIVPLTRGGNNYKSAWVPSKMLRDTIVGNFPSVEEAMKKVRDKAGIVPFSRRFAVHGSALIYKTFFTPVGRVCERTFEPILDEQHFFLKEVLMEDLK